MEKQEETQPLRMMRLPEVEEVTGLSGVTLWRLEREGTFPRRRKLSGRLVAWRSDEIQEWIEARDPVPIPDDEHGR